MCSFEQVWTTITVYTDNDITAEYPFGIIKTKNVKKKNNEKKNILGWALCM